MKIKEICKIYHLLKAKQSSTPLLTKNHNVAMTSNRRKNHQSQHTAIIPAPNQAGKLAAKKKLQIESLNNIAHEIRNKPLSRKYCEHN